MVHGLLFSPGVVIHHDWVIPPYRQQIIGDFPGGFFSAWQNGADVAVSGRGQLLLGLTNRLLSLLFGVNGEQLSKAYLVITLWLSGLSIYFVGRFLKKSQSASLLVGVFYMLTPWLFDRMVAGDFSRMFAYALLPICFLLFIQSIEVNRKLRLLFPFIIAFLFLFLDNIAFLVTFAVLILYALFRIVTVPTKVKVFFSCFWSLAVILVIFLASNLSWIIPSLVVGQQVDGLSLASTSDLMARASNNQLLNVFRSTSNPMGWFLSSIGGSVPFQIWNVISIIIPILAFSAILLDPKNKNVLFFGVLAAISIFLAKGINPPLEGVYQWAYINIPFMQVFRDPDKLEMVTLFAYSFLLIFCIDIAKLYLKKIKLPFLRKQVNQPRLWSITLITILFSVIFISSYPFLTGNFKGQLQTVDFPSYYNAAYNWLSNQSGDFKVLWLPPDIYTQYDWMNRSYQQRDIFAGYSPKPNIMAYSSDAMGRFSYFFASTLYHNTTSYLGKILAMVDVKYVILRNDADGWWWRNLGWTNDKLHNIIEHQTGLKLVKQFGQIDVYLNEFYTADGQPVTTTNNVFIVSGGFSSLASLSSYSDFTGYPVFTDGIRKESVLDYLNYSNGIVIKDGDFLSSVFSVIPQEYVVSAASYATSGDKAQGWAKLYGSDYWWLNQAYIDSVEETAISSTNSPLNLPIYLASSQEHSIWLKLILPDNNVKLAVLVDGTPIGTLEHSNCSTTGFSWVNIKTTYLSSGNHVVSIINNSSMRVAPSDVLVNSLVVVPTDLFENAIKDLEGCLTNKDVILLFEGEMAQLSNYSSWIRNDSLGSTASQGFVITSMGSSWASYSIFVPKAGIYNITLKANIPQTSNLTLSVDNKTIKFVIDPSGNLTNINLSTINLAEGQHTMRIAASEGLSIDLIVLFSNGNESQVDSSNNFYFKQNSPTSYTSNSCLQGPIFVILNQPFNPYWKAYVNGTEIPSMPMGSAYNIFLLNENSRGIVNIQFIKASSFEFGLCLALAAIFVTISVSLFAIFTIFRRLLT